MRTTTILVLGATLAMGGCAASTAAPCPPVADCETYHDEVAEELEAMDPESPEYAEIKACAVEAWRTACDGGDQ